MKLTDKIVAALPIPERGNHRTLDSEVSGLAVQVSAAGHRAFVLRYRAGGGQRQLTIGAFPTWTTMAARHHARGLRRLLDQGIDPLAREVSERAAAMTLADFWAGVYEPLHVTTKRPRWGRDIRSDAQRHPTAPGRSGGQGHRPGRCGGAAPGDQQACADAREPGALGLVAFDGPRSSRSFPKPSRWAPTGWPRRRSVVRGLRSRELRRMSFLASRQTLPTPSSTAAWTCIRRPRRRPGVGWRSSRCREDDLGAGRRRRPDCPCARILWTEIPVDADLARIQREHTRFDAGSRRGPDHRSHPQL